MKRFLDYLKARKIQAGLLALLSAAVVGVTNGVFESVGYQFAEKVQEDLNSSPVKPSSEFTEWMDLQTFKHYVARKDQQKFWDQGYWIESVEGKLVDGLSHFRIRIVPTPDSFSSWYWYYGINDGHLGDLSRQLSEHGYFIFHHNIFSNVDGSRRHQVIWRKKA